MSQFKIVDINGNTLGFRTTLYLAISYVLDNGYYALIQDASGRVVYSLLTK